MSMLPSGPGVVSWSMMKALKRDDVLVDVHDPDYTQCGIAHLDAPSISCI